MHFEIVSDKDVLVDAIGLLVANEPKVVTDDELRLFQVFHGVSIAKANFPANVIVTAVVAESEGGN